MKSIAAILLLSLLLFNWVGYELYTAVLQQSADKSMVASLNQDKYADADLISIKVPAVHLSAYVNSRAFERVDGQIEISGIQYNYVKRRFVEDSLELMCIPNRTATRLQMAKTEYFKLVNDLQHPGQSRKTDQHNIFKGFTAEYYVGTKSLFVFESTSVSQRAADRYKLQIPSVYLSLAGQPPDRA